MENLDACKKCQGYCCKHLPGCCAPSDFNFDVNLIVQAIRSGRYTFDWWEGDPREEIDWEDPRHLSRADFIRPSIKGMEGRWSDPTWYGGPCTFLGFEGCVLSHDDRPKECRELVPENGGPMVCNSFYGKREASLEWLSYQGLLRQVCEMLGWERNWQEVK